MPLEIKQNVPYVPRTNKLIVDTILQMQHGDYLFLDFKEYNRTACTTSLNNARMRKQQDLILKTHKDEGGLKIWCLKKEKL